MSPEPWINYVLMAVGIIAIVVAAIFVIKSGVNRNHILDSGWQFYFTPTVLEPPGTIFRIDGENRRYVVTTLPVKTQIGEETFGEYAESVSASLGLLARFLGFKDVSVNSDIGKKEKIVFKMDNPEREIVTDVELDDKLLPFLKNLDYRVDNRYFVIRECRKAKGITHHLTQSQVADLGGDASLTDRLTIKGTLLKSKRGSEFLLRKKFDKYLRVMFLPEEIKPLSAGLASEQPELGRVPVKNFLEWEDV